NERFGSASSSTSLCQLTPPSGYVTDNSDCDDARKLYRDSDGDGYGSTILVACGGVTNNTDCNDNNAAIHAPITYYRDADNDGFGSASSSTSLCQLTPPSGYVTDNSDCDDARKLYRDSDGDGYGSTILVACGGVTNNTDCNDNNAAIHAPITYYRDADNDGFGSASSSTSLCQLTPPSGYVTDNSDCDDARKLYRDSDGDGYGSTILVACGGVTNNTDCNDNNAAIHAPITYYRDADNDGFGGASSSTSLCQLTPPSGYVTNNSDCDDARKLYRDSDGDGYGSTILVACGGVTNNTDCNDNNAAIHAPITYYRDADNDGFGSASSSTSLCQLTPPSGYVTNNSDCDDARKLYRDSDGDGYGSTIL